MRDLVHSHIRVSQRQHVLPATSDSRPTAWDSALLMPLQICTFLFLRGETWFPLFSLHCCVCSAPLHVASLTLPGR